MARSEMLRDYAAVPIRCLPRIERDMKHGAMLHAPTPADSNVL